MVTETQVLPSVKEIIEEARDLYKEKVSVTHRNTIPDTPDIPIQKPTHWLKIPDVICVFVDMRNSTQLSASSHDASTAKAYQFYTGTAVKIFSAFESPYIDVRGDGVLALFDRDQPHRALAAAVSFRTFAVEVFMPEIRKNTGLDIGSHCGIDVRTVLVRKIGYKRYRGRTDRQNEVWAGKPVNMAAKLAGISKDYLLTSDRFYRMLKSDYAKLSCGCPNGENVDLWTEHDVRDHERFDFDTAYLLKSTWCPEHGREYCEKILRADSES